MHIFTQKFLPTSFNETWCYNSVQTIGENEIQLRDHLQINFQHSNIARLDIFPLYNFPKLWQTFPNDRQLNSILWVIFRVLSTAINFCAPPAWRAQSGLFSSHLICFRSCAHVWLDGGAGSPALSIKLFFLYECVLFRFCLCPLPLKIRRLTKKL